VERPAVLEVTAFGAAALAGLGTGFFPDRASLPSTGGSITTFEPALPADRRDTLYAGWKRAGERSLGWEE
jgi:glycerol kinase